MERTANRLFPSPGVPAALLLVLAFVTPVAAQPSGQINGWVRDQAGGPLPGVAVSLQGPVTRETATDQAGLFTFSNLPAGDYEVSASFGGFDAIRRAVRLEPAAALSVSLTLQIAVRERVLVTAGRTGAADVAAVPLAISGLSADELTRLPTRRVDEVAAALPSVTFTQNSTFGQLSIRGIGSTTVAAGGDPSSALYLDGVYLARPAMAFVDFLDLDRVEVLRGPQGTLYGRNAVGGALLLIAKPPTDDVDAEARVTGGNLAQIRADGRISGPLRRGRIMGSLSLARGIRDGYVHDLDHPDHRLGAEDVTAARGQLRIVISPRSEVLIASDISDQSGTPLTYNKVLAVKPGFQVDNPASLYDVRTSTAASARVRQSGGSVRFTATPTVSTTLVSLTAFRQLDNEYLVDGDVTELDLFSAHVHERQHQWSEEASLVNRHGRLTSVVGTLLFTERDQQRIDADLPPAGIRTLLDPRVPASSASVFGETTVAVTSALSATIGLRYTHEQKTIDNAGGRYTLDTMQLLPGAGYSYTDTLRDDAWTPRFAVGWQLSPQSTAYVSATKGFKSGGFNQSSREPNGGFAPEWAWNYEAGIKTHLLNDRARLNTAVFDTKYTNMQVQTPVGIGIFDIRNAARSTIKGVEVEGALQMAHGFEAGGHLAWLDARYDEYIAVASDGSVGDVAGHRLNNAPAWSGRIWAEWVGKIAGTKRLALTAETSATSTVFYTPFNDAIQRQLPYALLGARAEYGPSGGPWSLNAYARNLTGTEYVMATFATSPAAYGARPGPSREIGVQLVLRR